MEDEILMGRNAIIFGQICLWNLWWKISNDIYIYSEIVSELSGHWLGRACDWRCKGLIVRLDSNFEGVTAEEPLGETKRDLQCRWIRIL